MNVIRVIDSGARGNIYYWNLKGGVGVETLNQVRLGGKEKRICQRFPNERGLKRAVLPFCLIPKVKCLKKGGQCGNVGKRSSGTERKTHFCFKMEEVWKWKTFHFTSRDCQPDWVISRLLLNNQAVSRKRFMFVIYRLVKGDDWITPGFHPTLLYFTSQVSANRLPTIFPTAPKDSIKLFIFLEHWSGRFMFVLYRFELLDHSRTFMFVIYRFYWPWLVSLGLQKSREWGAKMSRLNHGDFITQPNKKRPARGTNVTLWCVRRFF
jgi:hypothetical protein